MDGHSEGRIVQWDKQACLARQRRGCPFSTPDRSVKMASLSTRSTSAQTEDPAATQPADPGVDGRSLQQWRSIQWKFWLELQKVQHSVLQTLEQSRDPGRRPRARSPTAMLEQLKDRIRNISQDMHALERSC